MDYLVTNDERLHKKARRLVLGNRVARAVEAVAITRDLSDVAPEPPPAARTLLAHDIDASDPIFDSLRQDYPGFDSWLAKCKREHRPAWAIEGHSRRRLSGVCIVKTEHEALGLPGKILKLCTFKVMEGYHGNRYGELLLKCAFDYAFENHFSGLYLTVYPKYEELIALMEAFGFRARETSLETGEAVLMKRIQWTEDEKADMDPLPFHIRFGPWTAKLEGSPLFVVPVQPRFHAMLSPELEEQTSLLAGRLPCGNSIRKAYLCKSKTRGVSSASNLVFYRSRDLQAATALGIVEQTLSSPDPNGIARFAGKRTVYTYRQIREMCTGPVLAILFRRVLFIRPPIGLAELEEHGIVGGAPQSIAQVGEKGREWLKAKLGM